MTTANTWTFTADTLTVNGHTFPASYSLARTGDVYVFATVKAAADAPEMPVRLHISASMPMHADAVAAAAAARKASKPAADPAPVAPAPAPVDAPAQPDATPAPAKKASKPRKASKPAVDPAPIAPAPAPVDAPAQPDAAPAPAKKASKPRKASKPAVDPAPVAPAPVDAPAQPDSAPAPAGKAWIGTTITGNGWKICFDSGAGRTRVVVDGTPTDAQRNAIEQAGFYWSPVMQSWNKKLTGKAYRAAQTLATTLAAIA